MRRNSFSTDDIDVLHSVKARLLTVHSKAMSEKIRRFTPVFPGMAFLFFAVDKLQRRAWHVNARSRDHLENISGGL
jgi:hypothetical protein